MVEEGPGREGQPDAFLSSGTYVEHPASGGEGEFGVGVQPKLEGLGEGDVGVPGMINGNSGGKVDSIKTEVCTEAKDVVDVVSMHGGDDALVVHAEEEVVVIIEVLSVL